MPKVEPERSCIVTREVLPKEDLIRFALSPDGVVVPDLQCKLPGRGCWVQCNKALVAQAVEKNHFSRAFKQSVTKQPELVGSIEPLMLKAMQGRLSMARASGNLLLGWDKASRALKSGSHEIYAWVLASDASARTQKDVRSACEFHEIELSQPFSIDVLSQILGKEQAVHAAFIHEGMAEKWLQDLSRLMRYRTGQV